MLKNKKILFTILMVVVLLILAFSTKSYAEESRTFSILLIGNANEVRVEKTIQLHAMLNFEQQDGTSRGTEVTGATWTSSNDNIATVDNNGIVTGVSEGVVTITAEYNYEEVNYSAEINLTIKPKLELPKIDINTLNITVPNMDVGDERITFRDVKVMANENIENNPRITWEKYNPQTKEYEESDSTEEIKEDTKYCIEIAVFLNSFDLEDEELNNNILEILKFSDDMIIKLNNKVIDKTNEKYCEFYYGNRMVLIKYYFDTAEPVFYSIIEGKDPTYTVGKDKTLTFKIDAPVNKFMAIFIDDEEEEIDPSNYEVKEGSTVVTFKEDYLKTLTNGKHELMFLFEDGYAISDLTIVGANGSTENKPINDTTKAPGIIPHAGGTLAIILSSALLIIAGAYALKKTKDLKGI